MGHCRPWDLLSFNMCRHNPFITGSVFRMTCGGIRRHLRKYMVVVMINRGKCFQSSLSLCILMLKHHVAAFSPQMVLLQMLTLHSYFCPEAAESFLQTIVLRMLAMHSHTFPPGVGMISPVILLGMLEKHSQLHSTGGDIFNRMNPLVNLWMPSHVYPPGGSIVRTEDHTWDACGDAEDAFSRLSTRWWHFDTTRLYWLC